MSVCIPRDSQESSPTPQFKKPIPFPGDLPNPGTEPGSPTSQADSLTSEPPRKPITFVNGSQRKS